jgi:putative transposase
MLDMVSQIRSRMPRIGGRKLFYLLQPHLLQNEIKLGRDAFFDLMRDHGLLIKPRRKYCKTTFSDHWMKKYDNLLSKLSPSGCEQVLVSDITYVATLEGFAYLFLVTDAFSRKILGHITADNMLAESGLMALEKATSVLKNTQGVIHHSDGGVQYCSALYTGFLRKHNMSISMTEPASPTQNAIAERVNGILKTEWIYHSEIFKTIKEAAEHIDRIIAIYNNERPHSSLYNLTPCEAHERSLNNELNLPKPRKKATVNAGDLGGMSCSECQLTKQNGHTDIAWPSCDIRHSPRVIPKTDKSPQVRPPLHKRNTNLLTNKKKKQIHLQTT